MTLSQEQQNKVMKARFQSALRENDCTVVFEKKDCTIRTMHCTLRPEALPEIVESDKPARKENDEIVPVWDLEKEAWRCFDIWTVQLFKIGDEVIYENCNA
jgi:hypothetical protein